MGLRAGGVALNLTAASHVFLMEPWWNPAMEQQAQARIHRLGQYKPIKYVLCLCQRCLLVSDLNLKSLNFSRTAVLFFDKLVCWCEVLSFSDSIVVSVVWLWWH